MGLVSPKSLKEYFWAKLNSWRRYSSLKYEYVNIRRVWNFSYYIANDYPEISLLADEPQKDINKIEINKEKVEEAIIMLKDWGDHENSLLLMLISRHYLYPGVLILIRFEDFGTANDGRRFLNIYSKGRARHEKIYVDEEIFSAVRELKCLRLSYKRQQYETKRNGGKGYKIKGYFIFPVQRCSIGRRLQNGFNGRIPEFSSSLAKIISVCKEKKQTKSQAISV